MKGTTRSLLLALMILLVQVSGCFTDCGAREKSAKSSASQAVPRTVTDADTQRVFSGAKYKKEVHKLNWSPEVGWNGLVVGKSTLSDAESKFGKARESDSGGGESQFVFEAPIRIWVDDKTKTIKAIQVFVGDKFVEETPATIHDAQVMYGPLSQVKQMEGCTIESALERKGLRINAQSMNKDGRVTSLFFHSDAH